jgi:anti-sigma factor RsiW
MIADYINGHLDEKAALDFERTMQADESLAASLQQASMIKNAVHQHEVDTVDPSFETFSTLLNRPTPWYSKWYNWVPVPAAALAVFLMVSPQNNQPIGVENEFETLTNASEAYGQTAIRVVANADTNVVALVGEYDMQVLKHYAGTNAVDVAVNEETDGLMKRLEQDSRIVLVKTLNK